MHQCWPSIGRISQHTGMIANTISKYIRQLEEKRLIDVEPTKVCTKSGEMRNGTLQFTIRPIQEAVNYHLERQMAGLPQKKHIRKRRWNQTRPCTAICGRSADRVGKQHRRSPKSAPLGPCEPVVGKSGGQRRNPGGRKPALLPLGEKTLSEVKENAERKKQAQAGLQG